MALELKTNTRLTREMERLTIELHSRLLAQPTPVAVSMAGFCRMVSAYRGQHRGPATWQLCAREHAFSQRALAHDSGSPGRRRG